MRSEVPLVVSLSDAEAKVDSGNAQPMPAQADEPDLVAGKVVGDDTPKVAYSPEPPSPALDVSDSVKPVPAVTVTEVDIE